MKIAVLGATGAVGREMVKILQEYKVPVTDLALLASSRSVGKKIEFNGSAISVVDASAFDFSGYDFVLGAVENEYSKLFAPKIVKSGAVYIDNSSAFRLDDNVPLVVPEINGKDAFSHNGIISNPNCSTIISMMAVAGISALSPITTMIACTYQAVSGAGQGGLTELSAQLEDIAAGRPVHTKVFPKQIAMNVIPCIGSFKDNMYTSEEMKMQNEGRRILHNDSLKVTCTCVRVPVMRSHSISITLRTRDKITVKQAEEAVSSFKGVKLYDYPTPLDTTDQDIVWVGRIREDLTDEKGLTLWCCGDQIRKGAASNAVQILELFL